jgi:simple sugar transport system permease protein
VQYYSGGIDKGYNLVSLFSFHLLNFYLWIALFIYLFIIFWFKKTKWGFHHLALGEDHLVAHAAGINVIKKRYWAVLFSGFFAGLSGACFVIFGGVQFLGTLNGKGYIALAILIFSQWKLSSISLSCALFACLQSVINTLTYLEIEWFSWFSQNNFLFMILSFVMPLVIMIIFSKRHYAPTSLGVPFDKNSIS